jgi:hypothetical protein
VCAFQWPFASSGSDLPENLTLLVDTGTSVA